MAQHWKCCERKLSRVQIPPPPQLDNSDYLFQTGYRMRFSAPGKYSVFSIRYSVFGILLAAICYFLFSVSPIFAQTIPASSSAATNSYTAPNVDTNVPQNLHTWTQNVMIETMAALVCQLAGVDPVNPNQSCLGVDQKTGKIGFVQNGGGLVGLMSNAITMLYTPPIHTGDYFRNLASGFGIVKQAHAETSNGTGFQGLIPLLPIWTAMRNIVYLLFVLVFVVIGIAIMLRLKIDPRTVMTVQNQIPKIIVGLLLVTFSLAIAGFLIDIMYTSIYLLGNTISQTDQSLNNAPVVSEIAGATNPFTVANYIGGTDGKIGGLAQISYEPSKVVGGAIGSLFNNRIGQFVTGLVGGIIGDRLGGTKTGQSLIKSIFSGGGAIIGTFVGGPGGAVAGTSIGNLIGSVVPSLIGIGVGIVAGDKVVGILAGIIAFLVITIALLWALFRLWFALISAYIFLLLDVVFSPFWIFAGLIPGSPVSFNLWLRDIVSNLATFPTAIVMFLLGKVVTDTFIQHAGQPVFVPPMVANGNYIQGLGAIIGLGFILLTPNVVNITKAALKAPKFDTTPIKQSLGVGTGSFTSLPGRAGQIGLMLGGIQNIPGLRNIPGIRQNREVAAQTAQTPAAGH